MRIAWLFNLDADEELRDPQRYTRTHAMTRRVGKYTEQLRVHVPDGDAIVEDAAPPTTLEGEFVGQAWCPTPRALNVLRDAGARLPRAPELAVLRRVNHRKFAVAWNGLEGSLWTTSMHELDASLHSRLPRRSSRWVAKRAFGFAARGHRQLQFPIEDDSTRGWLATAFAEEDGIQVEPWVERCADFAQHGWVEPSGGVQLGVPTRQVCDARGAWLESRPARRDELDAGERRALADATQRVADALHVAGYFGPFGVDAFRWRRQDSATCFNACSEVNARYSMGWFVGMSGFRPVLD